MFFEKHFKKTEPIFLNKIHWKNSLFDIQGTVGFSEHEVGNANCLNRGFEL